MLDTIVIYPILYLNLIAAEGFSNRKSTSSNFYFGSRLLNFYQAEGPFRVEPRTEPQLHYAFLRVSRISIFPSLEL